MLELKNDVNNSTKDAENMSLRIRNLEERYENIKREGVTMQQTNNFESRT